MAFDPKYNQVFPDLTGKYQYNPHSFLNGVLTVNSDGDPSAKAGTNLVAMTGLQQDCLVIILIILQNKILTLVLLTEAELIQVIPTKSLGAMGIATNGVLLFHPFLQADPSRY